MLATKQIKTTTYKEINIMRNYLVKRNNEGNDLDFLDDAFNSFFKPIQTKKVNILTLTLSRNVRSADINQ